MENASDLTLVNADLDGKELLVVTTSMNVFMAMEVVNNFVSIE